MIFIIGIYSCAPTSTFVRSIVRVIVDEWLFNVGHLFFTRCQNRKDTRKFETKLSPGAYFLKVKNDLSLTLCIYDSERIVRVG